MDTEPKISITEAALVLSYVGLADAIGIGLAVFGLDDFEILDIATFPVTQFYFRMKGVKASYDLYGSILEMIPYVGDLPIKTIGVAAVIWADRHRESAIVQGAETVKTIRESGKATAGKEALEARLAAAKANSERGSERKAA